MVRRLLDIAVSPSLFEQRIRLLSRAAVRMSLLSFQNPQCLRTTRLLSTFIIGRKFSLNPSSGACCVWLRSGVATPTPDARCLLHILSSRLRVNSASPPTKLLHGPAPQTVGELLPKASHGFPAKRRKDTEDALADVKKRGFPHQNLTMEF